MECTAHYADLNVYFSDISTFNGGILASSPEKRAGPSSGFRSVCGAFLLDFICITKGKKKIPIRIESEKAVMLKAQQSTPPHVPSRPTETPPLR